MIQSYICNLATLVPWDLIVWQPSWISAILPGMEEQKKEIHSEQKADLYMDSRCYIF